MSNQYKVVVVGAGVAGLYAAWRLAVDAKEITGLQPSDVLVLEASERTCGRLYTQQLNDILPGAPADSGLRAELGGMRFLNYHTYVGGLAQHFDLPYTNFCADVPANWHYLRGSVMKSFAQQNVYHLAPSEAQKLVISNSPGNIISTALIGPVVQSGWQPTKDGSVTLRALVDQVLAASYNGIPLSQIGLWNLLVSNGQAGDSGSPTVSNEAYALFTDAGAYDTIPANWNAATGVTALVGDFAADPEYYALAQGYMSLPQALQSALTAENVQISTNTAVTTITKIPDIAGYQIVCGNEIITADNVILALPPRALEQLSLLPSALPVPSPEDLLKSSTPIPLFKIFLVYQSAGTQPWWNSVVSAEDWPQYTRMTTDLPMRQIYNFGSYTTTDSTGKAVTYTLLQASYSDGLKAGYWAGQLTAEKKQAIDTDMFANVVAAAGKENLDSGLAQWNDGTDVSQHPLFQTVHQQFVALLTAIATNNNLPMPSVSSPCAGVVIDWGTDPFGGGVNFWNVGVDVQSVYNQILNPAPMTAQEGAATGVNGLFIVGEGYSLLQGWVEGALWSVEDALAKAYGSSWTKPSWHNEQPVPPPPAKQ